MSEKIIVKSITDTNIFAEKIAEVAKPGEVYALIGNLGTGKTTFTKGFAEAIGITESVGSPTFKLISEYRGSDYWLYHIDCYRLESPQQFINIGGEEYLDNPNGVTMIEWADIIEEVLPQNTIFIKFNRLSENTEHREIIVE